MNDLLCFYWAFSTIFTVGVFVTSNEYKNRTILTALGVILFAIILGVIFLPLFIGSTVGELDNFLKRKENDYDTRRKAKAYDEAIKKAAALYKASEPMSGCNVIIETLFPELAESEDERIRKEIEFTLEYLVSTPKSALHPGAHYTVEEAIAWLEKQESVDEIVSRCKDSWYNEGKIAGMAEGLTDDEKYQQGWHDALEKQGEQKPADSYCQENCKGFQETGKCFADGECKAKREAEQKFSWSEEDKDYYDAIIAKLEVTQEDAALTDNQMDFLKSLRPQKCLIPSEEEIEKAAQEWDSKANFNPFYMTMENGKPTGVKQSITTHKESFKAGVNWILKSLRCWKPSDEQKMQFFDMVCDWYFRNFPKKVKRLNHLVNLNKLKEEQL